MARRRDRGPRPPTLIRGMEPFHADQASTRPLGILQPPSDIREIVHLPPGATVTRVMTDEGEVIGFEVDPAAEPSDGSGAVAHAVTSHRDSDVAGRYW